MESLLRDLMSFYAKLDEVLKPSEMDCGVCGKCCKAISTMRVHPLEMENIGRYVKDDLSFNKFQEFANNTYINIWGSAAGHCPFQDRTTCVIYPVRPYYCRIYGHYDRLGKNLLEGCVYRGHAVKYSRREELPLIDEYDRLAEAFTASGIQVVRYP